jgi:predicted Zn-dependent protease
MAMNEGQLEDAAATLKARLERLPDDPVGTRLLGEVAWRRADMAEAMTLVRRALDLAPASIWPAIS